LKPTPLEVPGYKRASEQKIVSQINSGVWWDHTKAAKIYNASKGGKMDVIFRCAGENGGVRAIAADRGVGDGGVVIPHRYNSKR